MEEEMETIEEFYDRLIARDIERYRQLRNIQVRQWRGYVIENNPDD
jgi:L-2-hydroxyglutarate oxidase LhgO